MNRCPATFPSAATDAIFANTASHLSGTLPATQLNRILAIGDGFEGPGEIPTI